MYDKRNVPLSPLLENPKQDSSCGRALIDPLSIPVLLPYGHATIDGDCLTSYVGGSREVNSQAPHVLRCLSLSLRD